MAFHMRIPGLIIRCLLGLCLLVSFHGTVAQQAGYQFRRIGVTDGLSNGHVMAIVKDQAGFVWMATDGGLNQYNGYSFRSFKHKDNDSNSLSNNFLHDVLEDASGKLWVATESGLDLFDRKNENFTHFNPGTEIVIEDILEGPNETLWLGTTTGLYQFNYRLKTFKSYQHQPNDQKSLSDNFIYQLCMGPDQQLWIATRNGVNRLNPKTGKFTRYLHQNSNPGSLAHNWAKAIYADKKGQIWVGTVGQGVDLYLPDKDQFRHFKHDDGDDHSLSYNDILCFAEDGKGRLWIGTENGGISIYEPEQNQFRRLFHDQTDPGSISSNSIYEIYCDNQQHMWIGTWSHGANFLPSIPRKFMSYSSVIGRNSLSHPSVLSIAEDARHQIWIGTDGGGLNTFNPVTKEFQKIERPKPTSPNKHAGDFLIALELLKDGQIALGYHRGGLDIFNPITRTFTHPVMLNDQPGETNEFSGNALVEDLQGNIWIGAWGKGLAQFNRKTQSLTYWSHENGRETTLIDNFINALEIDNQGNIWIGTNAGLDVFNPTTGKFRHYVHDPSNPSSLAHNQVMNIFADQKGNMWVGTAGGLELALPDRIGFMHYNEKHGLPSDLIMSIREDQHHRLWLGTSNGICNFEPTFRKARNFDLSDGLPSLEFNWNSALVAQDGTMYFGTPEGFCLFNPDSLRDNPYVPPVYFTRLSLFNHPQLPGAPGSILKSSITETDSIQLPSGPQVITLNFAALNYVQPEKNQYAYKMEGFDNDWIIAGTTRSVTYTNLPPGSYTFRVKASNNDGLWSDHETTLEIVIVPPFWKTGWFYGICVFAIFLALYGFLRYRLHLSNIHRKELEELVATQTAELRRLNQEEKNARLNSESLNEALRQKNKDLEQFSYVVSHDLQEPLRTTTSFVKLLEKRLADSANNADIQQYVHFIVDASERMKHLIRDLLEYSRIGHQSAISTVQCGKLMDTIIADLGAAILESHATITVGDLPEIEGYPTELKLMFQNLLANAIKFRRKDVPLEITIEAKAINRDWEFSICDNGIGIDPVYHQKIFNIFTRLHTPGEYPGTGIGLSNCARVASLHKGRIRVESKPGKGSCFYVLLPSKQSKPDPQRNG